MILFELCFVAVLVAMQPELVSTQRWWGNSGPDPKAPANPAKSTGKVATPTKAAAVKGAVAPKKFSFDIGSGYEIFFDGRVVSFIPISQKRPKGQTGPVKKGGLTSLGRLLNGMGGQLLVKVNKGIETVGGPPKQVAGWPAGPTTEPPLGPNDRVNTTDVPEEIEARPDKTRAQRRALLKRMNPTFTSAQIEAQLIRDDQARAKMAATQSEPVVLIPDPPTPPTPVEQKRKLTANRNSQSPKKPRRVLKARRRKPKKVVRRKRPPPTTTTTTTPEPPETNYPATYPTTTYFYDPTTYPTPAYGTDPSNQYPQQNQFQQQQQQQQQQFLPVQQQQTNQQFQQQQFQPRNQQNFQQTQQKQFQPVQKQQLQQNQQNQFQPVQQQQFQQNQQQSLQTNQQQQFNPQQQSQQQQFQPQFKQQQQNIQPRQQQQQQFQPRRQQQQRRFRQNGRRNRGGRRQQRRNQGPPPIKIAGSEVDHILSLFG